MKDYLGALKSKLSNTSLGLVIILTLGRIYFGYEWFMSGWHKLAWITDGELNSQGYISKMVTNLATDYGDPFNIGRIMSKVADAIFVNMLPGVTDFFVVILELAIGIMLIIGFKLFWTILVAMFLNLQFFAAGSTNNFGYVIVNLVIWKWTKYFDLIGLDGFLRFKKGKDLL